MHRELFTVVSRSIMLNRSSKGLDCQSSSIFSDFSDCFFGMSPTENCFECELLRRIEPLLGQTQLQITPML